MTPYSRLYPMLECFVQLSGSSHMLCALQWQSVSPGSPKARDG